MKDCLFLFDIDGTILDSIGSGKKAFIRAFEIVTNKKIKHNISFLGGIDNVIFKDLYNSFNLSIELLNEYWERFIGVYAELLTKLSQNETWFLFPNVDNIIKLLNKISNLALVTGNIKIGAKIKLEKFNLYKYFPCGGYGDSVCNRKDFVLEAIKKSEIKYNKRFQKENIYLLGDTEKDIQSAIDNYINPILIDHKNRYKNEAKNWKLSYYGNFENINNFLMTINKN